MHAVQNHFVNKRKKNTSYILGAVCKLGLFCLNAYMGEKDRLANTCYTLIIIEMDIFVCWTSSCRQ